MSDSIVIRPFAKLGREDRGGWQARFHFSFSGYYDRNRMNWGSLRVLNDDTVTPDTVLPPHPHRSMEIITYVHRQNWHPVSGKIEGGIGVRHQDSAGNSGTTEPGDVQVMSVGNEGIYHSESAAEIRDNSRSVSIFQIWILPDVDVKKSTWGNRHFPRENTANEFLVFASGFKDDHERGALPINSFSRVVGARLDGKAPVKYHVGKDRLAYAVAIKGSFKVNGVHAESHDGVAIKDTEDLEFEALSDDTEILLIDTHP